MKLYDEVYFIFKDPTDTEKLCMKSHHVSTF